MTTGGASPSNRLPMTFKVIIFFPGSSQIDAAETILAVELTSTNPHQPLYRLNHLLRIVAHSIFENDLDILNVVDIRSRISLDYHQVSLFGHSNRTDSRAFAEKLCAVEARDLNRLEWGEACLHKPLN